MVVVGTSKLFYSFLPLGEIILKPVFQGSPVVLGEQWPMPSTYHCNGLALFCLPILGQVVVVVFPVKGLWVVGKRQVIR